jgi:hypothetical protein
MGFEKQRILPTVEGTVCLPRQVLVQVFLNVVGRILLSERTDYWSHVGWA